MSTVADKLRQAREAKNLTIHQVADVTKIRSDHIRALEEGKYDVFSAPVYIRGFVRTYSTLLKLDVAQTMAALDAELGKTEKFSEPPPLTNEKRTPLDFVMLQFSKVDWRKGLLALAAIAIITIIVSVFFSWRHYRTRDPLSGLKPGVYHSGRTNSGETLPVPNPAPRH
jgi:cytoskeletal protein RodZ